MLFITIDLSGDVTFVLEFFGVSAADVPTARIISMDTGKKFKLDTADLAADLPPFCQKILDGTAKVTYTLTYTRTHRHIHSLTQAKF